MSRQRANGKKSFAIGVLFGGIFGGLGALLFAPKSGDKMRKDICKKYNDVSEKASDIFEDMCDQTCELVAKAKDVACCAKEAAQKLCGKD